MGGLQVFDRVIGYGALDLVDRAKLRRLLQLNQKLISQFVGRESASPILVAGAGRGEEAILLQELYGCRTVGVDLHAANPGSLEWDGGLLSLQRHDLHRLGFRQGTFGLIYCYHALEHVAQPGVVLQELRRVLKPGGVVFIGFPNKRRLISYVDTAQRASFLDKVKWNINDYAFRLRREFSNEAGAHAGFTDDEFRALAAPLFSRVVPVGPDYMIGKYPRFRFAIRFLVRTGLDRFVFPSNYYVCMGNAAAVLG
jgi:SAM-dependent methyltransferase